MKNAIQYLTILLCFGYSTTVYSQSVAFSFANAKDTIIGGEDYHQVDVMIASQSSAGNFTMGSGQIYINYNIQSLGIQVDNLGNVEAIFDEPQYLLGLKDNNFNVINVYSNPILNDNTASRLSISWQQDRGEGCIGRMVEFVPQPLMKLRFKYADNSFPPDLCFETDPLFIGQTFTACGPYDCNSLPAADCTNLPNEQVDNDNFGNEFSCLYPPCAIGTIPLTSASSNGVCVSDLVDWLHLVSDAGQTMVSIRPMGNDLGNINADLHIKNVPVEYISPENGNNSIAFLQRSFKITTENEPTSKVRLRFYFTGTELNNLINVAAANSYAPDNVNSISDLVVTKYNGPTEDDVLDLSDAENVVLIPQIDNGTDFNADFIEVEVDGFSEFWLNGGNTNLPIELLSFQAVNQPKEVELKWQTSSELNSDFFEVQRSMDGSNFDVIGKVQAAGESETEITYGLVDRNPLKGLSYYRLRQVDLDGSFEYSQVVSVKRETPGTISIYPNPAKNHLMVDLPEDITTDSEIQIYNTSGQELLNMNWAAKSGKTISIPIGKLVPGTYFIKINNGELITKRFVKGIGE